MCVPPFFRIKMSYIECSLVRVDGVSGLPQLARLCHQWIGWMCDCQTAVKNNNNLHWCK